MGRCSVDVYNWWSHIIFDRDIEKWASLVVQSVKNLLAVQETWVQSLGLEDALEKEMTTHSSTLTWKIPWTEEPGGLQSMGSQRLEHNWVPNIPFIEKHHLRLIMVTNFIFYLYWSVIALPCCVNFSCTMKWISCRCTYILSLLSLCPPLIPPPGHHRALSWALCALQQRLTSYLFTHGSVYVPVLHSQFIPLKFYNYVSSAGQLVILWLN